MVGFGMVGLGLGLGMVGLGGVRRVGGILFGNACLSIRGRLAGAVLP